MPSQPCARPCILALHGPPLCQLIVLALIAACGDDQRKAEPPRPDPSLYSVSADQDGDGIPDAEEIRGWTLRIDATGVPDGIIVREVWSDPTLADTDGDGLDDRRERMAGSDPRATDTDGDGLFDVEEVLRFGSNPASVDSDRDAGGAERTAPLPAYFDGAELKLETNPDDPDGPRIPGPGATSPILADTDGDGMWDRDEFLTRSATVAEAPRLLVSIDPRYTATFYLDKAVTESETVEETSSVALSFGGSSEFHFSNTTDLINTIAFTSELEAAVFGSAGVGLSSLSAGARLSANMGVSHSVELTNKTTFGFELSADFSQAFDEQVIESRSRSEVISGARLDLQLLVENVGQVSGEIGGLSVAMAYVDAFSPGAPPELRPLAQLVPVDQLATVVRPGEAVAVQVRAVGLNAERARRLMANPKGLVLTPATYEVTTAGDENYAFARGTVRARTTALVVQRTDRVPALYQVASNIDRTPHGEVAGITLAQLLTAAGLDWSFASVTRGGLAQTVLNLDDVTTRFYSDPAPDLVDPPYPDGIDPGPRVVERGFAVIAQRHDGAAFSPLEDVDTIRYFPGDTVTLVLVEDADRDGLSSLEEAMNGTSDADIDTDGDGLSDFYEVRVPFEVRVIGQPVRTSTSSPLAADTDRDGVSDADELIARTDPARVDTDMDGMNDGAELADPERDPLTYELVDGLTLTCNRQIVGEHWHYVFSASDARGRLREVRITWKNGQRVVFPLPFARASWEETYIQHASELERATVVDVFGATTTITECPCTNETPQEYCTERGATCGLVYGTDRCGKQVQYDCGRTACGSDPIPFTPSLPAPGLRVCYEQRYLQTLHAVHQGNLISPRVTNQCGPPSDMHFCPWFDHSLAGPLCRRSNPPWCPAGEGQCN